MRHDSRHMLSMNGGEQGTARQHALDESRFPASSMREAALSGLRLSELVEQCMQQIGAYHRGEPSTDVYGVELLRRATVEGDQEAWAFFQQCLGEVVYGWLHGHPRREAACRLENEETFVVQAFERFWQATVQQQLVFRTLGGALTYLRASLHGTILDTLRTSYLPREVSLAEPGEAGEPQGEDRAANLQIWEVLQSMLPNAREQRVAYLLYHCGLKPREIVQRCPHEFKDAREIARLRHTILERLLHIVDHRC